MMFGGQYYYQPPGWEDKFDPTSPLTKAEVREALSLAIDREELNEVFSKEKRTMRRASKFTRRMEHSTIDGRWTPSTPSRPNSCW